MRRRRFWKWAKWACTLAAVLCAGLAVFSGIWAWGFFRIAQDRKAYWLLDAKRGLVFLSYARDVVPRLERRHDDSWISQRVGWNWGTWNEDRSDNRYEGWRAGYFWVHQGHDWVVGVNLLYPVLLTTIPASLLWYADRRRFGPGHCAKCGYDRRGLAENAPCPECGTTPR